MTVEEVSSKTFMQDFIVLIRDNLRININDTIVRPSNQNFVLTSYPRNPVNYPIITVTDNGTTQEGKLGMGSQGTLLRLGIEIRIWARNVKERDELFSEVYDYFRTNQLSGDKTMDANLHDFSMGNAVNVSESDVKIKVMEIKYLFLCV